MDVEIQLLGALRVVADGREIELPGSRKTRALLAVLALEPGEHQRVALCELIWPDTADPRAALRWSLTKLRTALGSDAVLTAGDRVSLDAARVATDLGRLTGALEAEDAASSSVLADLEARFAPVPLADLEGTAGAEFELWLESQRDRLKRLHQQSLGALAAGAPAEDALPLLRKRVALDPLNTAANQALLESTRRSLGRKEARAVLERARARYRDAGLAEAELLAAWRRLEPGTAGETAATAQATTGAVLTLPARPSLALLGFDSLTPESSVLAEGLAVDVTLKLARLPELFVTARASAQRFSLAESDPATIGRQLGVRYLVHGTAQRLGSRIRVTADLIGTERGEELWSERFERSIDDLFAVQDDIADSLVAALEPQIDRAEQQRSRILPTADLGAWECFHRAMWHGFRFTQADTEQAHGLLQRALRQDPQFARAHAALSFGYFSRVFLNASEHPADDLRRALESARESVSLEPRDAFGHWSLGRALYLRREHDQALSALDRALLANPNYAQGHYARGLVESHAGLPDQAASDLDMARRLSPFDPLLFAMDACQAISLALRGRHEEAADWAVRATREANAHFHIFAIAAACLHLAGRPEEAARQAAEAQSRHPGYDIAVFERTFPQRSDRQRHVLSDAMRAAGLR